MKRKVQLGKTSAYTPSVVLAYVGTLALLVLTALHPHHNLWAVNWWAYFTPVVPFGLFLVGLVFLYGVSRMKGLPGDSDISDGQHFTLAAITVILAGVLFWILRAQTHYLGDGYQLLSRLASDNPLIKPWNFGGIAVPYGLSRLVGDGTESGVLLGYQIVSIASGLILAAVVYLTAKYLFSYNKDRLLFLLGVMTAGTSLMFFGYVENYALFVVAVFSFGLVGLLVAQEKVSRFWILLPLALAMFFHIFGAILLPAALYLLVSGTGTAERIAASSRGTKIVAGVIAVLGLAAVFWYLYSHYYFFRFAFVPLTDGRFTVEGYTLFSLQHILDWLSLLLLLLPGLLVALVVLWRNSRLTLFEGREYRFLLTFLVCCLFAVFVLDPRLGMPRDWDLFSFAGVPLVLLTFYMLLGPGINGGRGRQTAILVIGIGLLALLPRAWSLTDDDVSVVHLKSYSDHDTAKSVPIMTVWINRLAASGDRALATRESTKGRAESPELAIADEGWALLNAGRFREAMARFQRVVEMNPMRAKSWAGIGNCFAQLKQPDSAMEYLRISDGLNPYNPYVYSNMGFAQFLLGRFDRAEELWLKASEWDSSFVDPLIGLFNLYTKQGHDEKRMRMLLKLAVNEDTPPAFMVGRVGELIERGYNQKARRAFSILMRRAPDAPEVRDLLNQYPELQDLVP